MLREAAPATLAIRFPATAPMSVWADHLDPAVMRGAPVLLALSGGGEDGAFGAGLLNGLSRIDARPEPDIVTGVSTGALMAPLAFAGPAYDHVLRRVYTTYGARDIQRRRGLTGLLGDGLYSSAPLRRLIERHLDPAVLDRVAAAHGDGRRLFTITSNLDTGQATVWNMGRIAASGATGLFHDVTLAAASIPALFPPVTIDHQVAGRRLREAHVDAGVNMQFLAVPDAALARSREMRHRAGDLYVIINNRLGSRIQPVPRSTFHITAAALATMVRTQMQQTLRTTREYAARTGLNLRIAAIGPDFDVLYDPARPFSLPYMRALYDYGYRRAVAHRAWRL